ncbi:MAG TPA: hypothetical protein VKA69_03870 [Desulfobacteria bacterium]|nr:hypothetical protein [Desulfobacteria bacterium]
MPPTNKQILNCAVHSLSSKSCTGDVVKVVLHSSDATDQSAFPHSLNLCQYHHQLELMVWGVKKFFEIYHILSNASDCEDTPDSHWQEALEPLADDSRLCFSLPEDLEFWLNRLAGDICDDGCHPRSEFEYLKEASIDLGEARLTDKQLMAVCMVFYGGVKKKRAAQAMNITSQALSDHIKAALKKIGDNLARI